MQLARNGLVLFDESRPPLLSSRCFMCCVWRSLDGRARPFELIPGIESIGSVHFGCKSLIHRPCKAPTAVSTTELEFQPFRGRPIPCWIDRVLRQRSEESIDQSRSLPFSRSLVRSLVRCVPSSLQVRTTVLVRIHRVTFCFVEPYHRWQPISSRRDENLAWARIDSLVT